MTVSLSVNLNAVALLRNRRNLAWPNLLDLAKQACEAGAVGITVHPRPDERHIRYQDVFDLRCFLQDNFPKHELNVEGYPDKKFIELVTKVKPHQITLVPDSPEQNTSDHGWDLGSQAEILKTIITELKQTGSRISLFCDPDAKNLEVAKELAVDCLEIYTGIYAATFDDQILREKALADIQKTASQIKNLGLRIHAGHDLTVENIPPMLEKFPDFTEMSIGHALIADSLTFGLKQAIKRFLQAMQ